MAEAKDGKKPLFHFEDELYEENPFAEQWDPSMYTDENRKKRKALRNAEPIKNSIQKFWKLLQVDDSGKLTKKGYEDLFVRICKVIRPNFDLDQAIKEVHEDFSRDARGEDSLSYEVFFDSMFELVDLWTVDIEVKEYEEFLGKVFMRMTIMTTTDSRTGETHMMNPKDQVEKSKIEDAKVKRKTKTTLPSKAITKKKSEKAVENAEEIKTEGSKVAKTEKKVEVEKVEMKKDEAKKESDEVSEKAKIEEEAKKEEKKAEEVKEEESKSDQAAEKAEGEEEVEKDSVVGGKKLEEEKEKEAEKEMEMEQGKGATTDNCPKDDLAKEEADAKVTSTDDENEIISGDESKKIDQPEKIKEKVTVEKDLLTEANTKKVVGGAEKKDGTEETKEDAYGSAQSEAQDSLETKGSKSEAKDDNGEHIVVTHKIAPMDQVIRMDDDDPGPSTDKSKMSAFEKRKVSLAAEDSTADETKKEDAKSADFSEEARVKINAMRRQIERPVSHSAGMKRAGTWGSTLDLNPDARPTFETDLVLSDGESEELDESFVRYRDMPVIKGGGNIKATSAISMAILGTPGLGIDLLSEKVAEELKLQRVTFENLKAHVEKRKDKDEDLEAALKDAEEGSIDSFLKLMDSYHRATPALKYYGFLLDNASLPLSAMHGYLFNEKLAVDYAVVLPARRGTELEQEYWTEEKEKQFTGAFKYFMPKLEKRSAEKKIKLLTMEPVGLPKDQAAVIDAINELVGFNRFRASTTIRPIPAISSDDGDTNDAAGKSGKNDESENNLEDEMKEEEEIAKKLSKALLSQLGFGVENEELKEKKLRGTEAIEKTADADLDRPSTSHGEENILCQGEDLGLDLSFGAWGQFCPVTLAEKDKLVKGDSKKFAVAFNGNLYAFLGEKERAKFLENPTKYISAKGPQLPSKGYLVAVSTQSSDNKMKNLANEHAERAVKEYDWKKYQNAAEATEAAKEGGSGSLPSGIVVISDSKELISMKEKGVIPKVVVSLEAKTEGKEGDGEGKDDKEKPSTYNEESQDLAKAAQDAGSKFAKVDVSPEASSETTEGSMASGMTLKDLLINIDPLYRRTVVSDLTNSAKPVSTSDEPKTGKRKRSALAFGGRAYCPVNMMNSGSLIPGGTKLEGSKEAGQTQEEVVEVEGTIYSCASSSDAEKFRNGPKPFQIDRTVDKGLHSGLEAPRVLVVGPPGSGTKALALGIAQELTRLQVPDVKCNGVSELLLKKLQKKAATDLNDLIAASSTEAGNSSSRLVSDFIIGGANALAEEDLLNELALGYVKAHGEKGASLFENALTESLGDVRKDLGSKKATAWVNVLDVHRPSSIEHIVRRELLSKNTPGIPHLVIKVECDKKTSIKRFKRDQEDRIYKRVDQAASDLGEKCGEAWKQAHGIQKQNRQPISKEDVKKTFENKGLKVEEKVANELANLLHAQLKAEKSEEAETVQTRRKRLEEEEKVLSGIVDEHKKVLSEAMQNHADEMGEQLIPEGHKAYESLKPAITRFPSLPKPVDGSKPDALLALDGMKIARDLLKARTSGFSVPKAISPKDAVALLRSGLRQFTKQYGSRCPVGTLEGPTPELPRRPSTPSSARSLGEDTSNVASGTDVDSFPVSWRQYIVFCGSEVARNKFMNNVEGYLFPSNQGDPEGTGNTDTGSTENIGGADDKAAAKVGKDSKGNNSAAKMGKDSKGHNLMASKSPEVSESNTEARSSETKSTRPTPTGMRVPHKVCILGGPRTGRLRVAEELRNALGLELINKVSMLSSIANQECGKAFAHLESKAKATLSAAESNGEDVDKEKLLTISEMTDILKFFTQRPRSRLRGWVLEGYPTNAKESRAMKAAGVVPFQVFELNCEKEILLRRILGQDKSRKDAGEGQRGEIALLENYFKHNTDLQQHFQGTYDNLYCLNAGSSTPWHLSRRAIELAQQSMERRRIFHAAWRNGEPARLYGMAITQEQIQSKLSPEYGWYCPVSWKDDKALRKRVHDYKFMSLYKAKVYCLADEAKLQRFEKDPDRYAVDTSPLPHELPRRLDYIHAHAVKAGESQLKGYDIVEEKRARDIGDSSSDPIAGGSNNVVEYKGKFYRFKNSQNLIEFMTFPFKYEGTQLIRKPGAKVTVEDILALLGKTVAEPLINAMTDIAQVRPVFPKLSASKSALIYLALHLKAHNKKGGEEDMRKYKEGLRTYISACSMSKKLAKEYANKSVPPSLENRFLSKKYEYFCSLHS